MADGSDPVRALVVGWYPGADQPFGGRFIADQAAALLATGRVQPLVASFEPIVLDGTLPLRSLAARRWPDAVGRAVGDGLVPLPSGAFGPDGIPVARLGTLEGVTRTAGSDHQAVHRERVLRAMADGLAATTDLVHAHVGYPNGAAAAPIAAALGVPLVITEHASFLDAVLDDPCVRERYRAAGLAARRLVAVSRMLAGEISSALPELASRVVVIPNTVDVAAFPLVPTGARRVDELLWVGVRSEAKGIETLLRAFALVRAQRPATTLRLIGGARTGDDERRWTALAAELGITDAVSFEPAVERAAVAAAMSRAAVFVHPSRRETFGVVAVEALATGLPVVATDSGGVTEVLGDDPDAVGALVPRDDPAALADGVLRTLDRRASFDADALRAHVAGRYAADAVGRRIADLYAEVLAEAGGQSRVHVAGPPAAPTRGRTRPTRPADLGPVVLVAFNRRNLDAALGRSPGWLVEGLTVVTSGDALPRAARTVRLDPGLATTLARAALWKRPTGEHAVSGLRWAWRLAIRTWWGLRAQRRFRKAVDEAVLAASRDAGAGGFAGGPTPRAPLVVCQSGFDLLAVAPAVESGRARLAPGGLRWLGDARWAERGGATPGGAASATQAETASSA